MKQTITTDTVKKFTQMDYSTLNDYIHELGQQKSLITKPELIAAGASKDAIARLVETGVLELVTQGIYMPENADFGERHSEVEVVTRFPNTVICLDNALNYYRLTTVRNFKVWIAYLKGTPKPVDPRLPIEAIPMTEPGYSRGIETHIIEGLPVKIYSQAKTIADCFTYEHLVGIDVAVEAFQQAVHENRCKVSSILSYIETSDLKTYVLQELQSCIEQATATTIV